MDWAESIPMKPRFTMTIHEQEHAPFGWCPAHFHIWGQIFDRWFRCPAMPPHQVLEETHGQPAARCAACFTQPVQPWAPSATRSFGYTMQVVKWPSMQLITIMSVVVQKMSDNKQTIYFPHLGPINSPIGCLEIHTCQFTSICWSKPDTTDEPLNVKSGLEFAYLSPMLLKDCTPRRPWDWWDV